MISVPLSIHSGSIVQCWVISCQSSAQVLQTQGDLLWISQSVAESCRLLTVTGVHFQLPAPTGTLSLWFIHSFWIRTKTLKGKEAPRGADMNQAFCTYSNPCLVVEKKKGCNVHSMKENHTRCDRERVNVDTLSDSLRNDVRPIMRVFLKGPEH